MKNAPTRCVFFDDLEEPRRECTRPQLPLSSVFVVFFFKVRAKSAVVVVVATTTTTEEPKRRVPLGNRIFRAFLVILFLLVSIGARVRHRGLEGLRTGVRFVERRVCGAAKVTGRDDATGHDGRW
jgi:hypothetical protein